LAAKKKAQRLEVTVGEAKVSALFWPGKGRPLIMLHGFMDCAEGFRGMANNTHRPCYAFDLPGFGRSQKADQPSFESYAERITSAVRQLNIGPSIWVGHSMGGAVCRAVADNPENHDLISALALITPAGFGPLPRARIMDNAWLRPVITAAWPVLSGNPLSMLVAYPLQISGGKAPDGAMLVRGLRSIARGPQGPAMAAHALNSLNHRSSAELFKESSFKGPVASLWGSRDRLIPAQHSVGVQQVFPGADVTTWPDMAHHPQREQPKRLQSWIEKEHVKNKRKKFKRSK